EACPGQPAERPVGPGPVQQAHFQLAGAQLGAVAVAVGLASLARQARDRGPQGPDQRQAVLVVVLQHRRHLVGLAAHGHEAVLLGHRAVEGDPVDLIIGGRLADLAHHQLHLEGLVALGEELAQDLGVPVGQAAGGNVTAVVLVPGVVRVPDPGLAQVLELVVAPDRGDPDAVVDLADLVQGARRVRRHEQDAPVVLDHHPAAATGDALPGVVRLIFHRLFWRDVERHTHRSFTPTRNGATRNGAGQAGTRVTRTAGLRDGRQRGHRPRGLPGPLLYHGPGVLPGLGVRQTAEPVSGDHRPPRVDLPRQVGAAGR